MASTSPVAESFGFQNSLSNLSKKELLIEIGSFKSFSNPFPPHTVNGSVLEDGAMNKLPALQDISFSSKQINAERSRLFLHLYFAW